MENWQINTFIIIIVCLCGVIDYWLCYRNQVLIGRVQRTIKVWLQRRWLGAACGEAGLKSFAALEFQTDRGLQNDLAGAVIILLLHSKFGPIKLKCKAWHERVDSLQAISDSRGERKLSRGTHRHFCSGHVPRENAAFRGPRPPHRPLRGCKRRPLVPSVRIWAAASIFTTFESTICRKQFG